MIEIVNNGGVVCKCMHEAGLLHNDMTLDDCGQVLLQYCAPGQDRILENEDDTFWEDFAVRAEELGYKLAY